MFNKEKTFPFTKEGFEEARMNPVERILNKPAVKTALVTGSTVLFKSVEVFAKDYESSGWRLIGVARTGLFWACMFVSFYGLYMMLFKKDDIGKKIIAGAFMVYLGSWLIPEGFIFIRDIFSK